MWTKRAVDLVAAFVVGNGVLDLIAPRKRIFLWVYSITNDGEAYLTSWAEECKKYQLVLDSFYLAYSCR